MEYAYIRVSTKEQNIDRQMAAIAPYQLLPKHIFCDYQSGKDFDRPQYKRLIRKLKPGDLLIIKSIDRLGRNYDEILEQRKFITKKIGADILVLDMSLLDTRSQGGDLTGALIADLVLQILAYVAQKEREFIHERQAEGIAAAKARGVRFGRRPIQMPEQFDAIQMQYQAGQITSDQAASCLGVSRATFFRRVRAFGANECTI